MATEKTFSPTTTKNPTTPPLPPAASYTTAKTENIIFVEDDTDFSQIFEKDLLELNEHQIVTGRVVALNRGFVTVDIGYKSEGQIPADEFYNEKGELEIKEGDDVEVFLESMENTNGEVVLSKDKAKKLRIWEEVGEIYENEGTLRGRITSRVKGGLAVDIGIKAFLPGSQVDLRPSRNLDRMLNEEFEFKIIKFNKRRANIVLSRRALLEVDRQKQRKETLKNLEEGSIIKGCVKNITDYGLFIDLGGIDGLLHVTDMTWGRLTHPSDMFNIGDELEVLILKFDQESEKVSLGLKQKNTNPWKAAAEKYAQGTRVKGKVVSLIDYGAFVEIEPGVEGLVHVSEMSWTRKVRRPASMFAINDQVEVVVKSIDVERQRISLSIKEALENPWKEIHNRYKPGSVVTGQVRNVTDFGIFVGLDEEIDGLVYISDISWNARNRRPTDLNKGDEIKVKVLNIDAEKERISLGIKQLTTDMWEGLGDKFSVGQEISGKVVNVTDFGVFVEVLPGVEGLLHISEMNKNVSKEELSALYKPDEDVRVVILRLDTEERRIALGLSGDEKKGKDTPGSKELREAVTATAKAAMEEAAEETPAAEAEETPAAEAEETPEAEAEEKAEETPAAKAPAAKIDKKESEDSQADL